MCLGHHETFQAMAEDMKHCLTPHGHHIYRRQLARELTVKMGCLSHSVRTLDQEALKAELCKWCGSDVGLRWTAVQADEKHVQFHESQKNSSPDAIQIEASASQVSKVSAALREAYSSDQTKGCPVIKKSTANPTRFHDIPHIK